MKTLQENKPVKAKKTHICSFCNGVIRSGTTYIKSTHADSGYVYDWKMHGDCSFIADRLHMYAATENCVTEDDFVEIVKEEHLGLMLKALNTDHVEQYSDLIQQLHHVNFSQQLSYVVRHYRKLDKDDSN